jgi:UTP--glucose-1-phosphate uridylyltransferase
MQYKTPTKAVITDAGFASRYLPITKTIPKAMLPLGNRPVMQLVVEECVKAGITEIIIVATPEGKPIYEDYFNNAVNRIRKQLASQGKEDRYESVQQVLDFPKIVVIEQDSALPYGNGSPIVSARNYLRDDEAFVALYSDDVVFGGNGAVAALLDAYKSNPDADAIIAVQEVEGKEIEKYASVEFKPGTEELKTLIEKPKAEEAPSQLASYGRYLLTPKVLDFLTPDNIGKDAELWTADAIDRTAGNGGKVLVARVEDGKWMTTGDPKNYFLAHLKYVLDNEDYADAVKNVLKGNN